MATWREIIKAAHIELSIVDPRIENLSETETQNGFTRLKMMLETWDIEGLLQHSVTRIQHTETIGGRLDYTVGPDGSDISFGGHFDKIEQIDYLGIGYNDPQVLRSVGRDRMTGLRTKYATYVQFYFYENNYPQSTLSFDVPLYVGDKLTIVIEDSIFPTAATLDTQINLPKGYERTILCSLALEIAPAYGIANNQLPANTIQAANMGKKALERVNRQRTETDLSDLAYSSGGNHGFRGHYR